MTKEITWGIIGCGDVMEMKNGPGLYKASHSKVKSVYSRRYHKAKEYAHKHNIPTVCESADEIFNDEKIDAVYIATPPNSHLTYALKSLQHKKPCIIEKPIGCLWEEGKTILKKSLECNIPVYVAFYRRGLEKFNTIKTIINSGKLGKPISGTYQQFHSVSDELINDKNHWRLDGSVSNGGYFVDMGCHVLDIFQFLMGDISSVKGYALNHGGYKVEDLVSGTFLFKNDFLLNGLWSYSTSKNFEQACIVCEKGEITFDILANSDVHIKTDTKEERLFFEMPEHIGMPFQEKVIDDLIHNKREWYNLESAVNNVKIVDSLLSDYRLQHDINYKMV